MASIIWDKFSQSERNEYIKYLRVFGGLSGLFKDTKEGINARKPYLYYRNHEQLFTKVFNVQDLTRKDSAFDALGVFKNTRVGIGLKTWIHSNDKTYQKVAEFNKLAPELITPLMEKGTPEEVVRKIAELRNDRIMLDKRLYRTDYEVYHCITRDNDVMNIFETSYDFIDMDNLKFVKTDGKVYWFNDGLNNYKFYKSKSVLLEEFDASKIQIIETVPIRQFDDPFELIKMITIPDDNNKLKSEGISIKLNRNVELIAEAANDSIQKDSMEDQYDNVIYLPLYQDKKDEWLFVSDCSGVNIRNSKPKTKGSDKPRPEYEIEIRISKWIHYVFPKFFGIDALNNNDITGPKNNFNLILPDGRILQGRVKQQGGKSLQTNPQGALGEWILKDVLGLKNRELVTKHLLMSLGIDSLKITKIDDKNFKITVAETGSYEKFKIDYKDEMIAMELKGRQLPYFKPDIVNEFFN